MLLARENQQHYYQEDRIRERPRKVRKVRRFKSASKFVYASVLLLAFLTFLLLTTRYAQITATGYEIVNVKKQLKALEAENQNLEMKIAQLQSLERIEAVAIGKLGMIKPDSTEGVQFVAVESKGTFENKSSVSDENLEGQRSAVKGGKEKPIAFIDALSKLLSNWAGKVARAEAGVASE